MPIFRKNLFQDGILSKIHNIINFHEMLLIFEDFRAHLLIGLFLSDPNLAEYLRTLPFIRDPTYQNCKLQNTLTFERKLILTFHKKPLSPIREIFQINPT